MTDTDDLVLLKVSISSVCLTKKILHLKGKVDDQVAFYVGVEWVDTDMNDRPELDHSDMSLLKIFSLWLEAKM